MIRLIYILGASFHQYFHEQKLGDQMHIDLQPYLLKCVSIAIYVCMTSFLPAWQTVG